MTCRHCRRDLPEEDLDDTGRCNDVYRCLEHVKRNARAATSSMKTVPRDAAWEKAQYEAARRSTG